MTEYIYTVIREHYDGSRAKRTRKCYRFCPPEPRLEVGGLYTHLGRGFPGMQRVLAVETKEWPD